MRPNLYAPYVLGWLALLLGAGQVTATAAGQTSPTTRIELVIDELRPDRSVPWPVTTGVPFPQGGLVRDVQCRLVDDRGDEQPLQAKVAATWDAARTSIRWLTIDFVAQPGRKYALEYGPTVERRAIASPLAVRRGDTVTVETGPLQVDFSPRGLAALRAVRADLNGDGRIADDEQIAGGLAEGDHIYIDQQGQPATSALDGDEREIVVEQEGPVRSCIRIDGWYTGPGGKRLVRYRTRYHLFAGLPLIKMIDEFRIVGSTRDVHFRDIALPLSVQLNAGPRRVTAGWGDAPGGSVSRPWNDVTQSVSLVQEKYRHFGNPECHAAVVETVAGGEQRRQEGERAGGWLQVADDRAAVTGSLRWFWQQFPKEWELTGDRLTLHLWSPRGGTLDLGEGGLRAFFGPAGHKYLLDWGGVKPSSPIDNFFYFAGRHALERDGANGLGINKHHEAWFHFAPTAAAAAGREYGELVDRQPLCLATGEWNCSTGVFGTLASRPNDSPYEAIVDRIFDLERYAQDAFGDYGWWLFGAGPHYSYQWDKETQRHYADPRRFEYHTYQRETQLWWCYLRSGERKFYDWAVPAENHWADVAVSHSPTTYSTEWRGGARGEATLHFPAGDWSIDSPLHYVRHHDTGEAWLRSAPQFWATYHRTLETTTLAYFLTGDERYQDVVNLWRDYWSPLAGARSDTADLPPWHREQLWFQPTGPGAPTKTWAEMLRDYAPFQSGSRHQMTLLFNLATLYEQTWDPAMGKVLSEYANAFLDPDSPNGVWQCQDHRLPANADSPMLAHYWSSALWKYARAANDPRMPDVLRKYFTACIEADPYAEEVGIYSNTQIGWAWHFTHDPRHLVAAQYQLDEMLPAAAPLAKPEDLGGRIYNPYYPIQTLATVPRLIGALADAKRRGVSAPTLPPLTPQRALIALRRQASVPLRAVTWGWDRDSSAIDAEGNPIGEVTERGTHRSHVQPFDRVLPGHQVFRSVIEAPVTESGGWCFLSARLETGLLELHGVDAVWCWGGEPLRLEKRRTFWWPRSAGASELVIQSVQAGLLRVSHEGRPIEGKLAANSLTVPLADLPADAWLSIETRAEPIWFQLAEAKEEPRWLSTSPRTAGGTPPVSLAAQRARPAIDTRQTFVPGKFGQGMLIVPGRALRIPDEVNDAAGKAMRLSNQQQGTIEFWIRLLVDDRLTTVPRLQVLDNGPLQAWSPWKLPFDEWAHVAFVWHPLKGSPGRTLSHFYVDGRDYATYRNLYWDGYAGPPGFNTGADWRKEFVVQAPPGVSFAVDDIRVSTEPRYADLNLDFGSQQTFNPVSFEPPTAPASHDKATVIYLPLDGDAAGTIADKRPATATIQLEARP